MILSLTPAIITALGSAIVPVIAVYYYESGGNLATFMFLRTLISFLIIIPLVSLIQRKSFLPPSHGKKNIFIWSLFLLAVYVTYFAAVKYIDVGLLVIIFFSYPLFVVIANYLFGKEVVVRSTSVSVILCFIGLLLVVGPTTSETSTIGLFLAVASALFMAGNFLTQKSLTDTFSSHILLFTAGVYMMPFLLIYLLMEGWQAGSWEIMGVLCVMTLVIDFLLQYSLRKVGSIKTSMVMNFEPVFALVISSIFLQEIMSNTQYIGCLIVIASLAYYGMKQKDSL